jgi:hypothetical protein
VLSFVLAFSSMLFWAIFLLPFFEHGRTIHRYLYIPIYNICRYTRHEDIGVNWS